MPSPPQTASSAGAVQKKKKKKNIKPISAKDAPTVHSYVGKGGNTLGMLTVSVPKNKVTSGDWAAIHNAPTAEEALSGICLIDPRRAIICHPAIKQWANDKFASKREAYVSHFQFLDEKLGETICSWRDNEFTKDMSERPRSLVLWVL